jgi:alpha-tubulin suppressor-like RCC1 family protein
MNCSCDSWCQLYVQALQVAAGGMHTVALADDGTVWSWGVNDEGALGRQTAGELWDKASERVGRCRRAACNIALLCIPSKLVISAFLRCSRTQHHCRVTVFCRRTARMANPTCRGV